MSLPTAFPAPKLPAPDSVPALRWGVLAPGGIAEAFVTTLHAATTQRAVAVGSRELGRAQEFASKHGIAEAYGSYEALVAAPNVDVVYVAAPHHVHHELALLAISAGKHVLVEKPFTATARQAREVFEAARTAGVFAMEAMWTRYLPQASIIRQVLADGVLGEIRLLAADHGQLLTHVPRLVRPELAGGAIMDLGVYPVSFASSVLGPPTGVSASGWLHETGVDAQSLINLSYSGPAVAQLSNTLLARTPMAASIAGTDALLEVVGPFYRPTGLRLVGPREAEPGLAWDDVSGIRGHQGLAYQATALAEFVGQGLLESPLHTHAETVSVMETLDAARHQLGYRLSGE